MSYVFHTLTAKSISYGRTRSASSIKYIVLHYTGNKTDTAKGNASYFSPSGSNTRAAGAHYFVDDTTVYQSIPDTRVAWSVGGSKYSDCSKTGGGKMYGIITNSNSISIEMCSKNGKITDTTVANAVALTKVLMKKYGIPASRVYRHFDVNGKPCPGWTGWIAGNVTLWNAFKKALTANTESVEKKEDEDDMKYYKNFSDIPTYYQPAVKKLIDMGAIVGTGGGELNVSEDLCRILTILNTAGVFDG